MNVSTRFSVENYEAAPELDTPRYVFGDVAAAADVSPGTLKAWLSRDPRVVPLGLYDRPGRGKGIPRLFTLRRVYGIAMTSELVALGFAASKAGQLGFAFTDLILEGSERRLVETRGPLVLAINPKHDLFAIIISSKPALDDLIGKEHAAPNGARFVSCAVIDCAALMASVLEQLNKRGAT
jgi:hypothetical protein